MIVAFRYMKKFVIMKVIFASQGSDPLPSSQSLRQGKLPYTTHATHPILLINFSNMYKQYYKILTEGVKQYLVCY